MSEWREEKERKKEKPCDDCPRRRFGREGFNRAGGGGGGGIGGLEEGVPGEGGPRERGGITFGRGEEGRPLERAREGGSGAVGVRGGTGGGEEIVLLRGVGEEGEDGITREESSEWREMVGEEVRASLESLSPLFSKNADIFVCDRGERVRREEKEVRREGGAGAAY